MLAMVAMSFPAAAASPPSVAGEVARLRGLQAANQWASAESLATALLSRLEGRADADSLVMADALYAIGLARIQQGMLGDTVAVDMSQRALAIRKRRLRPDDAAIGDAETSLGVAFSMNNEADSAAAHARRGLDLRLRQAVPNDSLVAESWFNLGTVETARGRGRDALDALQHALEATIRAYGPNDHRVASTTSAMGEAWGALHDIERERDLSEQALAMLDRSGTPDVGLRGEILSRIAGASNDLGDVSRAFDAAQAGVRTVAPGDTASWITSEFNLGVILQQFGDNAGAREVLSGVLPVCERFYGSHWMTGRLRQTLGLLSAALGDTATAMQLDRQSEQDLMAHREPQGSTVALSVQYQAELLHAQHRDREARAMNERAIQLSEESAIADPWTLPYVRYLRLRILESLRDTTALDSARVDLARIRDRFSMRSSRSGPAIAYWLARADRDRGRQDDAWAGALDAERSGSFLTRLNLETLPDSRALELAATRSYMLNQVLDMAGPQSPSRWETAWGRLVRSRGVVRAALARRRLPRGLDADTAVVRRHDAWVTAKRTLSRRLVQTGGVPRDSAAAARLDALRLASDWCEADYAQALRARGADTARAEVGLADVRARLAPGQALVSFAEIQGRDEMDRVIAFVARGGDARVERLEIGRSDSLRALIAPWRERLAASPGPAAAGDRRAERACRRAGVAVRERTWDRIAPRLGDAAEVFLVPDGPLTDIPWHALPTGANAYLVEQGPVVHVLEAERELVPAAREHREGGLLAIGDPDYDRSSGRDRDGEAPLAGGLRAAADPCALGPPRFGRLPGTGREALAVAEAWHPASGATVRRGPEATEAAFKQLAPGCAVIHLATHGIVTGDRCRPEPPGRRGLGGVGPIAAVASSSPPARTPPPPVRSPWMGRRVWLALAGANRAQEAGNDADDGLLTADEVVTLDLPATPGSRSAGRRRARSACSARSPWPARAA